MWCTMVFLKVFILEYYLTSSCPKWFRNSVITSALSLAMKIFLGFWSFWKIEAALFIQCDKAGSLPSRASIPWSVPRTCTPKSVFPAKCLLKKSSTFCLILVLGLTKRFSQWFTLSLSCKVMIVLWRYPSTFERSLKLLSKTGRRSGWISDILASLERGHITFFALVSIPWLTGSKYHFQEFTRGSFEHPEKQFRQTTVGVECFL